MKSNKKGQSLVEYALILALVTVVAIAALQLLGRRINNAADNAGSQLDNATKNAASQYCSSLSPSGTYNSATGVCIPGTPSSGT